jgi:hypothetical protein
MRAMRWPRTFFSVLAVLAIALLRTGGSNARPFESRERLKKTGNKKLRQRSSRELPRPAG